MPLSRRAMLLLFAIPLVACSGVRVRKTETPTGPGYELSCVQAEQCTTKAERLCKGEYQLLAENEPMDTTDGRHHWTITCGGPGNPAGPAYGSGVATPYAPAAQPEGYVAPAYTGGPAPVGTPPMHAAQRLTLEQAREASTRLEPMMARPAVESLLGRPRTTAVRQMGSQTAAPWPGLMWSYEWWIEHPPECSAGPFCRGRTQVLEITFEPGPVTAAGPTWLVNSWVWR